MAVTIQKIAELSGVSRGTVDRMEAKAPDPSGLTFIRFTAS